MKRIVLVLQTLCLMLLFTGCFLIDGCTEVPETEGLTNNFYISVESDTTWFVELEIGREKGSNYTVVLDGEAYQVVDSDYMDFEIRQVPELTLGLESTIHSFLDTIYIPLSPVYEEMKINDIELVNNDTVDIPEADIYQVSWNPILPESIRNKMRSDSTFIRQNWYDARMNLVLGNHGRVETSKSLSETLADENNERYCDFSKYEFERTPHLEATFSANLYKYTGNQNERNIYFYTEKHYYYRIAGE